MSAEMWAFTSSYVVMPRENVDTDQIIPARFLTTTDRTGLGPHAFHDWRYRADGSPNPDFILNQDAARDARVLVARSEEHTSELQSHSDLVCRLLLEKKKK